VTAAWTEFLLLCSFLQENGRRLLAERGCRSNGEEREGKSRNGQHKEQEGEEIGKRGAERDQGGRKAILVSMMMEVKSECSVDSDRVVGTDRKTETHAHTHAHTHTHTERRGERSGQTENP